VDLRRETLIEGINKYSDTLIQKIEKLKWDCVAKSKEGIQITQDLDKIKAKMNELNSMFNSLEIDDIKLDEIMSKKKSNELSDLMGPVLKQYKLELQGRKYHKLVVNQVKLENVIGSLRCSDFDTDIMKVNINENLNCNSHSYVYLFKNYKMDSAIMSAAQQISFLTLSGFENKLFSLLWRGSRDGFDAETFHRPL